MLTKSLVLPTLLICACSVTEKTVGQASQDGRVSRSLASIESRLERVHDLLRARQGKNMTQERRELTRLRGELSKVITAMRKTSALAPGALQRATDEQDGLRRALAEERRRRAAAEDRAAQLAKQNAALRAVPRPAGSTSIAAAIKQVRDVQAALANYSRKLAAVERSFARRSRSSNTTAATWNRRLSSEQTRRASAEAKLRAARAEIVKLKSTRSQSKKSTQAKKTKARKTKAKRTKAKKTKQAAPRPASHRIISIPGPRPAAQPRRASQPGAPVEIEIDNAGGTIIINIGTSGGPPPVLGIRKLSSNKASTPKVRVFRKIDKRGKIND